MISYKIEEAKEFRKTKFRKYYAAAKTLQKKFKPLKFTNSKTIWGIFRKHHKKRKLNINNPPKELVEEMLLKGERKICEQGYIYLEYKEYRAYLHRLVILHNNINIPKYYTIHHIDKNKLNNNLNNLCVLSWKEHMKYHNGIY